MQFASLPTAAAPCRWGLFVTRSISYKRGFFWARRLFDGQELEATRVDACASSHLEDSRKKENARDEYRKDAKANGKRNTAKSVQHGIVARLACLIGTKFAAARPKATQSN